MNLELDFPAALLVGAALAVSGAVLQSVLRNPLAEPYLLGSVGGAALFAALAVNAGLVTLGLWVRPLASFIGSSVSLSLVFLVGLLAARARARNGADPALRSSGSTIVLAGFAVGGLMGSLDMLVLSYSTPADFAALSKWLYGSFAAIDGRMLALAAVVAAAAWFVLSREVRAFNLLELGRDEAECLGVNARRVTVVALAAVSLLTAVSVALAGAVGFVGLVVPHFVRRLAGPRLERVLPLSALAGGLFLVFAEVLVRTLPGEIPVGVLCAILGAPFFLFLLASRQSGEGRDV